LRVDFEAAKGIISIKNLLLDSDDLKALARGTIDINTNLEMNGQMAFPRARAMEIPDLRKWGSYIPANIDRIILDFTLTGDLSRPKFKAALPTKILEVFRSSDIDMLEWFEGTGENPISEEE
jgi:hypothetical protein